MAELRYIHDQLSGAGLEGEKKVIKLLVDQLLDDCIVIPWAYVDQISGRGSECDVLVLARNGLFLIEVKDWHGKVSGHYRDGHWSLERHDGAIVTRDSPVRLLQAKRLQLLGQAKTVPLPELREILVQEILTFPNGTEIDIEGRPPARPPRGKQPALQMMHYGQLVGYIKRYHQLRFPLDVPSLQKIADRIRPLPEIKVGSCVGSYDILRELGTHNYGFGTCQVFRAKDSLGRMVRIKEYTFDPMLRDRERRKQINEIKRDAAATIALERHPAIPIIYNDIVFGNRQCIIIEWVKGRVLRAHVRRQNKGQSPGPALIAQYVELMAEVCDVLAYVHANGVIHRDLRPTNILLASDGRDSKVVLLNFDSARVSRLETISDEKKIGRPAYTSPEQQADPHNVDERTDLYAVGAILYEALSNRKYTGARAPHVAKLNPRVGKRQGDLVHQCLAQDRSDRPTNAQELARSLRRTLNTA